MSTPCMTDRHWHITTKVTQIPKQIRFWQPSHVPKRPLLTVNPVWKSMISTLILRHLLAFNYFEGNHQTENGIEHNSTSLMKKTLPFSFAQIYLVSYIQCVCRSLCRCSCQANKNFGLTAWWQQQGGTSGRPWPEEMAVTALQLAQKVAMFHPKPCPAQPTN